MPPFLNIQNLSCGYNSGFRVHDINLKLPEGSFAGIIGPNGSGKTTLFRGISGTLSLKEGNILLEGTDLSELTWREKAQKLAIVSQFSETAELSVEEYVLMGRLPYRQPFQFFDRKEDIEIAHHYMHLTNTYRLRHKSMTELSGGERQMANIACALSQHPRLLLLDEPTSHLDITHQMQFMNLIQRLNEEMKLSVMMILHDLSLAAEYCDFLLMMKNGTTFCQGAPEVVITYEHIENVYDTIVIVKTNPISGKPVVFPVSEQRLRNGKK
ncbi:iron complex transport system ATP-binding protein [Porphyromonadaceae bacterium NLAE-zl-C104]|uniref:ABC transporter ATP-binding protein n=1 Tax=Proteiniphilum TaxID=294702 RepID=UPI00089C0D3D|nr:MULTISPECIES: ABC transporter ATP-binding protein [Proteiniphilum]MDY9920180.1 ABC transporter ATP-binding protein [Proteiniphilum sp.]SEA25391.1 iron complex transport system ATP-binding protein [Porphyromonadaceae bacterium KH3R12]SFT07567.1 iron complex transport system ATP-binding protein [Porphyromonadaceae bacterium NLAE-zl-C104]